MSQCKLHVLGCASQVPTRHRNHNGYFLQWANEGFLFDPGEGTQRQMILCGVSVSQITKIFITHFHGDHCLGLAGIIQRLSLDRVKHKVEIWYPASGQVYFDRLRHASIFHETAELVTHPISEPGVIYSDKRFSIEALPLDHSVETYGYRIKEHDGRTMEKDKLQHFGISGPAVGQLVQDGSIETESGVVQLHQVSKHKKGRSMAFIMDTRLCKNAYELAHGADLLVCESTYLSTEGEDAQSNGHLTAAQAADIARESNARLLVLTHFSQRYPDNAAFVEEASAIHSHVVAVKDGDQVTMPK